MSDEQKFEAFKRRTVAHNEEVYGAEIRAVWRPGGGRGQRRGDGSDRRSTRNGRTWAGRSGAAGGPVSEACPPEVKRTGMPPSTVSGSPLPR